MAVRAAVAGFRQNGRKRMSVRGSNHRPIESIGVSTIPGSVQFTRICLPFTDGCAGKRGGETGYQFLGEGVGLQPAKLFG